MTLNPLHILFLIFPFVISEEFLNHNYDGMNKLMMKRFYDTYKESAQANQALRLLNYFNKGLTNELTKSISTSNVADSITGTNITPEITMSGNENESNSSTQGGQIRKNDAGSDLFYVENYPKGVAQPEMKHHEENVEVHVFRMPNRKHIGVHGEKKYYAPWGYYISQPSNSHYNKEKNVYDHNVFI